MAIWAWCRLTTWSWPSVNSGETQELIAIMDSMRQLGGRIVVMTGDLGSTLAKAADVVLDVGVQREACPLGLAPTASTTAALAMGDALAVALINRRSFKQTDFRRLHPAGSLGERLSVQVQEVMITGRRVPKVKEDATIRQAVKVMNKSNLGVFTGGRNPPGLEGYFYGRRSSAACGRRRFNR